VEKRPGLGKFLKHWLNRVNALERFIGLPEDSITAADKAPDKHGMKPK
jgi:hypothetical protein